MVDTKRKPRKSGQMTRESKELAAVVTAVKLGIWKQRAGVDVKVS
jgi:hypothetical protein